MSMEKPVAATRREDGLEKMASALAEGGFRGPAGPQGDEDVNPRQEGDAFIAKRIDGSTLRWTRSRTS